MLKISFLGVQHLQTNIFQKKNIFDLSCIFNSFLGRKVPINEFLFIPGEHWFLFLLTLMICVDRLINTEWLGCPRLFPGAKLYTPRKNYSSQKFKFMKSSVFWEFWARLFIGFCKKCSKYVFICSTVNLDQYCWKN